MLAVPRLRLAVIACGCSGAATLALFAIYGIAVGHAATSNAEMRLVVRSVVVGAALAAALLAVPILSLLAARPASRIALHGVSIGAGLTVLLIVLGPFTTDLAIQASVRAFCGGGPLFMPWVDPSKLELFAPGTIALLVSLALSRSSRRQTGAT